MGNRTGHHCDADCLAWNEVDRMWASCDDLRHSACSLSNGPNADEQNNSTLSCVITLIPHLETHSLPYCVFYFYQGQTTCNVWRTIASFSKTITHWQSHKRQSPHSSSILYDFQVSINKGLAFGSIFLQNVDSILSYQTGKQPEKKTWMHIKVLQMLHNCFIIIPLGLKNLKPS